MSTPSSTEWRQASRRAVVSGAAASVLSSIALAICGWIETRTAAGGQNGPSQWLFGRHAAHRRGASVKYTGTGYAIHHAMSTGWALLHERFLAPKNIERTPTKALLTAGVTAAVACTVDYVLTPRRLQPGFDAQLSRRSMALVYAAFALGLACGGALHRQTARARVD